MGVGGPAGGGGAPLPPPPAPDAPEWHALAERALAAGRDTHPAGVPDGFHYEITVDGRTVHAADPALTEDQRDLISRVLKEGA
ncbi:protealysin inhibitor emfourin [Streptomyces sp. NPDC004579]|uniref:protealysin inhibitor emfourin n=1 Tax=Streptomyces sp. NPDC004579 TaxID=3154667 RepID=UPI0033A68988